MKLQKGDWVRSEFLGVGHVTETNPYPGMDMAKVITVTAEEAGRLYPGAQRVGEEEEKEAEA